VQCARDENCPTTARFCKDRRCVECESKNDCPTDRPNCSDGVCRP
jgi:hypothetical protein